MAQGDRAHLPGTTPVLPAVLLAQVPKRRRLVNAGQTYAFHKPEIACRENCSRERLVVDSRAPGTCLAQNSDVQPSSNL